MYEAVGTVQGGKWLMFHCSHIYVKLVSMFFEQHSNGSLGLWATTHLALSVCIVHPCISVHQHDNGIAACLGVWLAVWEHSIPTEKPISSLSSCLLNRHSAEVCVKLKYKCELNKKGSEWLEITSQLLYAIRHKETFKKFVKKSKDQLEGRTQRHLLYKPKVRKTRYDLGSSIRGFDSILSPDTFV